MPPQGYAELLDEVKRVAQTISDRVRTVAGDTVLEAPALSDTSLNTPALPQGTPPAFPAGPPDASPIHVLIVDDYPDAADSLAGLARLWGCRVTCAHDGVAGYEAACRERPDCAILDINMPGMDGYTLARRLRQVPGLAGVKLVALSANASPDHDRRVREAGFDYQLTKPAPPDELRETLHVIRTITELAEKTERLSRQNVELAGETKDLLEGVKHDIREIKRDVRELKQEIEETGGGE